MTNNNNNLKISILEQLTLLDTNDNFFNINISPLYPQIYLILSILILVTLFPILDYLYKKKYIYIKLISFFSYNIIF